jgi:hypothetical protein
MRERVMAKGGTTVRRTLHLRFTAPSADPKHLASMMQAAKPFFEFFGGKETRLLQNVDDPSRFIQVIEYETPAELELNRQRIASDPRLQTYLNAWRSVVSGGVDFEVFWDVGSP